MACCGDVPTLETLAAVAFLRTHALDLKVRIITEHGEGLLEVRHWQWGDKG